MLKVMLDQFTFCTVSRFETVAQIKVKHVFDSKKCVSFVLELSKSFFI